MDRLMFAVAGGAIFVRGAGAFFGVKDPDVSFDFLLLLASFGFALADDLPSSAPYFSSSCCVESYLVACLNLSMA